MSEILDSGTRREFVSGAVRDCADGKGRCDLLPLDVIAEWMNDDILDYIGEYIRCGNPANLWRAVEEFCELHNWDFYSMLIEVSKQFEDGANKYKPRNWESGILLHCYIDSGVRHYIKYCRGDKDEPHDRAVCWNLLCAIWTQKHKPEMIDLPFADAKTN